MNKSRDSQRNGKGKVLNGFSPPETARIAGLSVHMINYLARHGYLVPAYGAHGRGIARYYSYRDLMIARIIARLLAGGLEISRLKNALLLLAERADWMKKPDLGLLVTDGNRIFLRSPEGSLADLSSDKIQLAFAFVLDVRAIEAEVKGQIDEDRKSHFSADNRELRHAKSWR